MQRHIRSQSGFTLVELLVVITILAIISITAYTSFSGSTDKAKNSTKLSHIGAIETGLNAFFVDNAYYPMPSQYDANTNVWGYNLSGTGELCNTFTGSKNGDQIVSVSGSLIVGGGPVKNTALAPASVQIGAKGTVDSTVLSKQYLSQEVSDPAIKDLKVGDDKTFKDFGLGEYAYAVYAKNNTVWTSASKKGSAYNLAATISDDQKGAVAKITGNFDDKTCVSCPKSLIGPGGATDNNLTDGKSYTGSEVSNRSLTIPYAISGF